MADSCPHLTELTLLNHSGFFFLARASVELNPAIIPADATVVRNATPVDNTRYAKILLQAGASLNSTQVKEETVGTRPLSL